MLQTVFVFELWPKRDVASQRACGTVLLSVISHWAAEYLCLVISKRVHETIVSSKEILCRVESFVFIV